LEIDSEKVEINR